MKKISEYMKKILAMILAFCLMTGAIPAIGIEGLGTLIVEAAEGLSIDNGYIKVTVSEKNGGYGIRTMEGDKLNKDDNNKKLLFEYDDDNTSFTSFQVTRNGETKEYIFGGTYEGSSKVSVSKVNESLVAQWSVDDLTFTQTISLTNSGANEHGTANISYTVENAGSAAQIKCRMLMDTCLGEQDYAYYNVGDSTNFLEREVTLVQDGYNKTFYAFDEIGAPSIAAYIINAAIEDVECKPYQTTFAHWNNLASTIFDYTADYDMTFTNPYNKSYQTADSAFALYFDMGQVDKDVSSTIGTNYGIFSNETVTEEATVALNNVAPDVLSFAVDENGKEDQSKYENEGKFTVKTYIENFGSKDYEEVKVLVYTTGGILPVNQSGNVTNSTYDNPYFIEISDFTSGKTIEYDWNFFAEPKATGQYAKIHYKVYDVSDGATQNSGAIMQKNLLGEGSSYILCPGSVNKIPAVKFTGMTPDTVYCQGIRNLYLTGDNFSMLSNKSEYKLMLSRADGYAFNGKESMEIPAESFEIDTTANKMSIMLTDEIVGTLPTGVYKFTIDYVDAAKEDITAPALQFNVSDSLKYRNDAYGFLAVIRTDDNQYYVKNYASEELYQEDTDEIAGRINREDVLLEFRGIFIKEALQGESQKIVYKGISQSKSDNIMTLNDCLDIKNGSVTIIEENGSVKVDFDADLYTTGAGTSVWSGVCALTELEAGTEYSLIGYDGGGERTGEEYGKETIALLWPSVGQGFQELMGLLFEFKYGEFGVISDEESDINGQRVIAFGAALDLSFIIPDSINTTTTTTETDNTWSAVMQQSIDYGADTIRSVNRQRKYNADTVNTKVESHTEINRGSDFSETGTAMGEDAEAGDGDTKSASVQIDDVLFGNGYMGINMSIALGIPGYLESMPGMQAILNVNTIGDWSFGASGVCEFSTFAMEGSIRFLSKDNIPIPDEISFFIGGFVPGVCLDGFGILWLQGGGGGISNLYDTIFLDSGIPPLKLLLEVQVSLMQVISAKASLGLSLSGIDASISNGKLINALPVLRNASVSLQWYPEFFLSGALNVSIMDAIIGSGYMVVEQDGFFEFFIRAALQIPGSIPIIGGINIADANLGANVDKIWGQIVALGNSIGVTYFWGEDIDWFSGSPVYPTYPELVGMEGGYALAAYPIGVNEKTGQNLYVGVGTNLVRTAATVESEEETTEVSLLSDNTEAGKDELYTNITATNHTVTLQNSGCGKILTMEWKADSLESARQNASGITIKDNNQNPFNLIMLDSSISAEEQTNANANLTYDETSKMATLAVAFNNSTDYEKVWNISTPVAATIVAYEVEPLPTVSEAETTISVNNDAVTVNLGGDGLSAYTKASFIAKNKETNEETLIFYKDKEEGFQSGESILFKLPENLSSGTYEISIVLRDTNAAYYSEVTKEITFVNPKQPAVPAIASIENVGDYKLAITLEEEENSESFDGYVFDAYKISEGENSETIKEPVPGVQNLLYYKDGNKLSYNEDGTMEIPTGEMTSDSFVIGGHYESSYTDEVTREVSELVAGFSEGQYVVEVKQFKIVAEQTALLYSNAASQTVNVRKPVDTEVTVSTVLPASAVNKKLTVTPSNGESYEQDFVNSSEISLVLSSASEKIKGHWELDGGTRLGTSGEIAELTQETSLYFANLEDGTHTLEFIGENEYGDSTAVKYRFTVDTQGPRLMLAEPINGSLFDYKTGEVTITGITDKDAVLTVIDNDTKETLLNNVPMSIETKADTILIEEDGGFTTSIILDSSVLNHNLTIRVTDELGNVTEKEILLVSDGLGSIEKLLIYAGNEDVTNKKIKSGTQYNLNLYAKLDGQEKPVKINNELLVEWSIISAEGESTIEQNNTETMLKTGEGSEGMVTANFQVNDAGAYSVSVAFGENGDVLADLGDGKTKLSLKETSYYFTNTAIEPEVTVEYDGVVLEEGIDYEVSYENNTEVSEEKTEKPTIIITGLNGYGGSVSVTFEIVYLEINAEEPYYEISGTEGMKGYYTSDVSILPMEGYEVVTNLDEGEKSELTVVNEGRNELTFQVRRLADEALTDVLKVEIYIDKSLPTGSIILDEKIWDTFLSKVTFGWYKVKNLVATVTAEDNISGVGTIQYIVSEEAYESVAQLEAAGLNWKNYSDVLKPSINENKNQIIYVRITDNAGNRYYISSEGIQVDTVAPVVSDVKIYKETGLTATNLKFSFVSNEPGNYYYAVMNANEPVLDAETIKAGTYQNAVMGSGNINADMVGQPITVGVSGLQASTMYIAYVVVEDVVMNLSDGSAAPNISVVAASRAVSTLTEAGDILPEDLEKEGLWIAGVDEKYTYTGAAIKPTFRVYDHKTLLTEKVDYTVSYKNNKKVHNGIEDKNVPTITIKGKGNYAGKVTKTFAITAKDIKDTDIVKSNIIVEGNHRVQKKKPTVKWGNITLKNNRDYTLEYVDAVNADAYKLPGDYQIKIIGKGNFTGEDYVTLTVTENELISKATVSKIANQTYTGEAVCPKLTVKHSGKELVENKDYKAIYDNNVEIGTATVTISGNGDYIGEKQVNFKIVGNALKGIKVDGVPKSVPYTGKEITKDDFESEVVVTKAADKLTEGKDYEITFSKNEDKGTATMIVTGIGKYTGTVKKTFKIDAYNIEMDSKGLIIVEQDASYAYAKGGVKPEPVVKFGNQILEKGIDYTLSYKNNTAINDGSNAEKMPTIIIKGKGNFAGEKTVTYKITKQDISLLEMTVEDKVYTKKKNGFKATPIIKDFDGKKLKVGKDYNNEFVYTYKKDTTLEDGTVRYANEVIQKNDVLPADTEVIVTVTGCNNYEATTLTGEYRIVAKGIGKAKVEIAKQTYTGAEVKPDKEDITVKIGNTLLTADDYDIISYNNNVKKGTATLTIKGKGNYGGTKSVKYSIKAKTFVWYWDTIAKFFGW